MDLILLILVNFLPVDVDSFSDRTFVSSNENKSDDVTDVDGMMSVVEEEDGRSRAQSGQHSDECVCG